MALQLTFARSGVTYTNTYHRVTFGHRDKRKRELTIVVRIYASQAYADTNPSDVLEGEVIHVAPEDFDEFFASAIGEEDVGNLDPEARAYEFLKTINPAEEGSRYPSCRFDYKNDATDV